MIGEDGKMDRDRTRGSHWTRIEAYADEDGHPTPAIEEHEPWMRESTIRSARRSSFSRTLTMILTAMLILFLLAIQLFSR